MILTWRILFTLYYRCPALFLCTAAYFNPVYVTNRPEWNKCQSIRVAISTLPALIMTVPFLQILPTVHAQKGRSQQKPVICAQVKLITTPFHPYCEVLTVPADGRCLLHAVDVGLAEEGIKVSNAESLCKMLLTEVTNYTDYYRQFSSYPYVIGAGDRYFRFKE